MADTDTSVAPVRSTILFFGGFGGVKVHGSACVCVCVGLANGVCITAVQCSQVLVNLLSENIGGQTRKQHWHGPESAVNLHCTGSVLAPCSYCHDTILSLRTLLLQWDCAGIGVALPWYHVGVALHSGMALKWRFSGVALPSSSCGIWSGCLAPLAIESIGVSLLSEPVQRPRGGKRW